MTNSIGREFMQMSKYKNMQPPEEEQGIVPQPPLELPLPTDKPLTRLPAPASLGTQEQDAITPEGCWPADMPTASFLLLL